MRKRRGIWWRLRVFTEKHTPRHDELKRKYTRRSPRSLRAWWEVYLCGPVVWMRHAFCSQNQAMVTDTSGDPTPGCTHTAWCKQYTFTLPSFCSALSEISERCHGYFWQTAACITLMMLWLFLHWSASLWAAVEPEVVSLLIRISLWDLTLIKKWINYPSWQPWYAVPAVTQWVMVFFITFFVKEVIVFIHYTQQVKAQYLSFCLSYKLCLHTGNA